MEKSWPIPVMHFFWKMAQKSARGAISKICPTNIADYCNVISVPNLPIGSEMAKRISILHELL